MPETQKPQESNIPTIDIIVSVVDNYGDMGFAVELITLWRSTYGDSVDFVIWTDDIEKMRKFARDISSQFLTILSIGDFGKERLSEFAISLLHTPIPDAQFFAKKSLVLRVDYLSLDPDWIKHHESHHIQSTDTRPIIELIQSPLPGSAGLLPLADTSFSKKELAKQLQKHTQKQIDEKKDWITIFAYSDTIADIDWSSFPEEVQVLVFGKMEDSCLRRNDIPRKNIIVLPLLPLGIFHSFLFASDWSIVRGDMTGSMMLQSGKPYYWDIYREIGGVHSRLSDAFLNFIEAGSEYRTLHNRINLSKNEKISYTDCVRGFANMHFRHQNIPNLLMSIKKYVDRFYFSL